MIRHHEVDGSAQRLIDNMLQVSCKYPLHTTYRQASFDTSIMVVVLSAFVPDDRLSL